MNGKASQLPARRRADLLEFVRRHGQAKVSELSEAFGVSVDTVRRDLDHLAGQGAIARDHGGAVLRDDLTAADNPFTMRMADRHEAKERIATAAAELVGDGQTVILNGGTTTLAIAPRLVDRRDLTIVTNNLLLPPALPEQAVKEVHIVGGTVRMRSMVTLGRLRFPDAEGRTSHPVQADLAIIGVGAIALDGTVGTSDLREAQVMSEMISASARVALLADASKFGRRSFAQICTPEEFGVFVTDDELPEETATVFEAHGVEVVVA